MSQRSSPWRANDAVLFDILRNESGSAIAITLAATGSTGEAIRRIRELRTNLHRTRGYTRTDVAASLDAARSYTAGIRLNHPPIDRPAADTASLQATILQALFEHVRPRAAPTFTLLAGAADGSAARAIGHLSDGRSGELVVISAEELRAFHPMYLDRRFRGSLEGQQELSGRAASWLQASISQAREERHSLLLEGAFRSPEIALSVARRFANVGYEVHLAAVAAREDENLLAITSRELLRLHDGQDARFITPGTSAQSLHHLSALVEAAADSPVVDRISVIGRHGESLFDALRSESGTLDGAVDAISTVQVEQMTTLEAAEWLSDLRHMTRFATSLRAVPRAAIESLIELHERGINRVVPELRVPDGSKVVQIQLERLSANLAVLRRMEVQERSVDVAAPILSAPETGPSVTR